MNNDKVNFVFVGECQGHVMTSTTFCELPDVQPGYRKGRGTRVKLPTSTGSWKKQENSRKTFISALLTMPKPLTVWITINWKILKEMGIPDHLTCRLRNLYAGWKQQLELDTEQQTGSK